MGRRFESGRWLHRICRSVVYAAGLFVFLDPNSQLGKVRIQGTGTVSPLSKQGLACVEIRWLGSVFFALWLNGKTVPVPIFPLSSRRGF